MNHRVWVLGGMLLGLVGCAQLQTRGQSADEGEREKEPEVKTIGSVTEVDNAEPIPVSGVGLVTGLDGTGGGAPPGGFRTMLEDQLKKRAADNGKELNAKEILASKNNAMVLVSALIPAGARKGDPVDIEVTLPPGSKSTSLRGGYLQFCLLYNYDNARRIAPHLVAADQLV